MRILRWRTALRLMAAAAILGLWPTVAAAASCRAEVGAARAETYVRQCLAITTATHPPCNAENSCRTIGEHIQYMCAHDPHPPAWCAAYKATAVPNPPPQMVSTARPGFDCAKASSLVDREICAPGNDAIATDDRRMSRLYLGLLAKSADKAALRAGQLTFLHERERCSAPEPGRKPADIALDHCISELTHLRIDELTSLSGGSDPWGASGPSPTCEASFGDDGWDQLTVMPAAGKGAAGKVVYEWFDMREPVLETTDTVAFEVGGASFPARIAADGDGQPTAVATDPRLVDAMGHGGMVRVSRNGKVIFRAALAGFPAAYAKARQLCPGTPSK